MCKIKCQLIDDESTMKQQQSRTLYGPVKSTGSLFYIDVIKPVIKIFVLVKHVV